MSAISKSGARTWELTLDAELQPDAATVTVELAQAVADLLAHVPDVTTAAVTPHCQGRYLLAIVSVEACDLAGAIDLAAELLRRGATATGAGPLVLVGARCSGRD